MEILTAAGFRLAYLQGDILLLNARRSSILNHTEYNIKPRTGSNLTQRETCVAGKCRKRAQCRLQMAKAWQKHENGF